MILTHAADITDRKQAEQERTEHLHRERHRAEQLRQLAEAYRFEYVVTDAEPELPLPLLYRNESYAVYKMD